MLQLNVLGSADLRNGEGHGARSVLAQPKRFALLTYLVMEADPTISRDQLLAVFWPDLEDGRARAALSQSLYHLRKSLGADWLENVGDHLLRVDRAQIECDALTFLDHARAGRGQDALQVYSGPFLEAFHLDDAWAFTEWASGKARELAKLAGELAAESPAIPATGRGPDPNGSQAGDRSWSSAPHPPAHRAGDASASRPPPATSRGRILALAMLVGMTLAATLWWNGANADAQYPDGSLAPPPIEAYVKYESAVDMVLEGNALAPAKELLNEALALDPDFPEALGLLSFLLLVEYPISELKLDGTTAGLDSAEVLVRRAASISPNRPMVLAARGAIDSFRGRFPSEHHERVLRSGVSGPARGISAIFYGYDLVNVGSPGRAIAALEAGIGHYPLARQSLWGHANRLAKLDPLQGLARLEDIRRSMTDLGMRPFQEYGQNLAPVYGWMAVAVHMTGDHDRARALADTAIMLDRRAVFRALPGDIAFFQGNLSEAAAHYEVAMHEPEGIETDSRGQIRTKLGAVLVRLGRTEEGRRLLEEQWAANQQSRPHADWEAAYAKAGVRYAVVGLEPAWAWRAINDAAIQANLGNLDQAMDLLLSMDPRFVSRAIGIEKDPLFEPLSDDPRFQELLDQLDARREQELEELERERERLGHPLCDASTILPRSWSSRPC